MERPQRDQDYLLWVLTENCVAGRDIVEGPLFRAERTKKRDLIAVYRNKADLSIVLAIKAIS